MQREACLFSESCVKGEKRGRESESDLTSRASATALRRARWACRGRASSSALSGSPSLSSLSESSMMTAKPPRRRLAGACYPFPFFAPRRKLVPSCPPRNPGRRPALSRPPPSSRVVGPSALSLPSDFGHVALALSSDPGWELARERERWGKRLADGSKRTAGRRGIRETKLYSTLSFPFSIGDPRPRRPVLPLWGSRGRPLTGGSPRRALPPQKSSSSVSESSRPPVLIFQPARCPKQGVGEREKERQCARVCVS